MEVAFGSIQKLRNAQRGKGSNILFTYRYLYFEGEGVFHEIVSIQFQN